MANQWVGESESEMVVPPGGSPLWMWRDDDFYAVIARLNALQAVAEAAKKVSGGLVVFEALDDWKKAMAELRTALAGLEAK